LVVISALKYTVGRSQVNTWMSEANFTSTSMACPLWSRFFSMTFWAFRDRPIRPTINGINTFFMAVCFWIVVLFFSQVHVPIGGFHGNFHPALVYRSFNFPSQNGTESILLLQLDLKIGIHIPIDGTQGEVGRGVGGKAHIHGPIGRIQGGRGSLFYRVELHDKVPVEGIGRYRSAYP